MAKILVITSQNTGRGHMSIANALHEQFEHMPELTLDVVDGFAFLGTYGVQSSNLYNVVTQHVPFVWDAAFRAAQKSGFVPEAMGHLIQKRFESYVRETKPDLILTVHPMFVGSVLDALERAGLRIPVVCMEADIVDIHSNWVDPRVETAICPTEEARDCSLRLGMPPEKLVTIGFPTRGQFCNAARNGFERQFNPDKPLKCLMTGGGGGAGEIEEYALALLEGTDVRLTVICGNNQKLREKLEAKFGIAYSSRIRILGFVTDMESEFELADLAIMRASPNCMFEAIVMGIPMLLTGALPGQERDNPRFAEKHGLGVKCEDPAKLPECVRMLTADGCRRLMEIRDAQKKYRDLNSSRKIAEFVRDMALRYAQTPTTE